MEPSPNDDVSLESTVLTALMRLQNGKTSCKKQRTCNGVSTESIVKYLKSNISWLDGDVESQVMTTILSCVKTGLVCALDCGKYRLIQPKSKNMVTSCITRVSHGSNCTCLKMLKTMARTFRRPCCVLKIGTLNVVRGKKTGGRKSPKKPRVRNCALKAQEQFGKSNSSIFKTNGKCNYCLEFHAPPKKQTQNVCKNCNCLEVISGVPADRFSPRDESSTDRFCDEWK